MKTFISFFLFFHSPPPFLSFRFESSLLYMQDLVGKHRMSVVCGDILEVDEEELFAKAFEVQNYEQYIYIYIYI